MQEKRKYIRIKPARSIKVKFKIIHDKKHRRVLKKGKHFPKNISGGGMFIELPLVKPDVVKGLLSGKNRIALELKVPGYAHAIKILGKAIWTDKKEVAGRRRCGIGIQFEEIQEEDRERLLQHMLELILQ